MTTLYKPVRVTREGQRDTLPPGSFMHPDCRHGGILTYLVPIDVEVEHIRETGGQRREKTLYITPWTIPGPGGLADEAQALADCGDQA